MTAVKTSAQVTFGPPGTARVETSLRLTGNTWIQCSTYPDHPPILSISEAPVSVTVTVADTGQVTDQDLMMARQLAAAAAEYLTETERLAATNRELADPDDRTERAA